MIAMHTIGRIMAGSGMLMLLAGCETLSEPFQSLAGASSMRVDVEVYKGPLANMPSIQWGDLVGAVSNASNAITRVSDLYEDELQKPKNASSCGTGKIRPMGFIYQADNDVDGCKIGPSYAAALKSISKLLSDGTQDAISLLDQTLPSQLNGEARPVTPLPIDDKNLPSLEKALSQTASVASQMQADSQWLLRELAVTLPAERKRRMAYATLANTLCEYGNQIGTRADALAKELHGLAPERFSTGAMIRNTRPCATLDAFVWFAAFDPPLAGDVMSDVVAGIGADERRDRVRSLERTFADLHWAHVNTVFAAGQGKTTMALIRDQYGNWDLKAFENDASELLQGYTALASSALDAAAKLAADTATGGAASKLSTLQRLLVLSQQAEAGQTASPPDTTGPVVAGARQMLVEELQAISNAADSNDVKKSKATDALRRYEKLLNQMQDAVIKNQQATAKDAAAADKDGGQKTASAADNLAAVPVKPVISQPLPATNPQP